MDDNARQHYIIMKQNKKRNYLEINGQKCIYLLLFFLQAWMMMVIMQRVFVLGMLRPCYGWSKGERFPHFSCGNVV